MKRHFFSLAILLLLTSLVAAQNQSELQRPDADVYLQTVYDMRDQINDEQLSVIQVELETWYFEAALTNFEQMEAIYQLTVSQDDFARYDSIWTPLRVITWLNSSETILQDGIVNVFDALPLQVTSVDLDSDGNTEWVATIVVDFVESLLVIRQDESGIYRLMRQPVEAVTVRQRVSISDETDPSFVILSLEDATGDGHPDVSLYERQNSDYNSYDTPYVLSLRDGIVLDVIKGMRGTYHTNDPIWQAVSTDNNRVAIQEIRETPDNWDCYSTLTKTYEWLGEAIELADETRVFEESPNCTLRKAEESMVASDYANAITLYEEYIATQTNSLQYVPFRLGIALMMNGDLEAGIEQIRQLQVQEATNGIPSFTLLPLFEKVLIFYNQNPSSVGMCLGAYDFFLRNPIAAWYAESIEAGYITDDMQYGSGMPSARYPDPAKAGCDLPSLLNTIIPETIVSNDLSPFDELTILGVVSDIQQPVELNKDGILDWLLYMPTGGISPVLMLSDASKSDSTQTTYNIQRPLLSAGNPLGDFNEILDVTLGNGIDEALITVDYTPPYRQFSNNGPGPGGVCAAGGNLQIWRLVNGELTQTFTTLLCELVEAEQLVDNQDLVTEIYGWEYAGRLEAFLPVTYRWQETTDTYELTATQQITLTPPPFSTQSTPFLPLERTPWAYGEFMRGEYEKLLEKYQFLLNDPLDLTPDQQVQWRYFAALSFERLNRFDEAALEYQAIYEQESDSAWGQLAALHLKLQ